MKILSRTILVLAVAALLIVGGAAAVYAAGPATNQEVHGNITAIVGSTVQITPEEGTAVTVTVTPSTVITKAGMGKAALSDLAVGDRANATYDKTSLEASRITVSAPLAKHHAYVGVSSNITANQNWFTVTPQKGTSVQITVNAQTKYKVPGVKDATLANFMNGDKVAVLTVQSNGGNLALQVVMIPGKPAFEQREGTVTAYTAANGSTNGSITITNKKGDVISFVVTPDTQILVKLGATAVNVGDRAVVTARRVPATNTFTAKNILDFGTKQ